MLYKLTEKRENSLLLLDPVFYCGWDAGICTVGEVELRKPSIWQREAANGRACVSVAKGMRPVWMAKKEGRIIRLVVVVVDDDEETMKVEALNIQQA